MADLGELVSWFESDEFELETALDKYKEAEKLAGEIEKDLSELKNEITVLKQKFDA
jgi:exodeoxyribonuclease VII small subunit